MNHSTLQYFVNYRYLAFSVALLVILSALHCSRQRETSSRTGSSLFVSEEVKSPARTTSNPNSLCQAIALKQMTVAGSLTVGNVLLKYTEDLSKYGVTINIASQATMDKFGIKSPNVLDVHCDQCELRIQVQPMPQLSLTDSGVDVECPERIVSSWNMHSGDSTILYQTPDGHFLLFADLVFSIDIKKSGDPSMGLSIFPEVLESPQQ